VAVVLTQTQRLPLSSATFRDIIALGKPRLSFLVLFTAGAGMVMAPGTIKLGWVVLAATSLLVWAANALNSFIERDIDGLMERTRNRPLPARRMQPQFARTAGLGVAAFSTWILLLYSNELTALLGIIAFVSYVWIYTPMKAHSSWAVVVGAIPGAIPPLMGWTAVTNKLDAGGLSLFALLFCWQLPHFLAIATYLHEDYARAGLKVLPVSHGRKITQNAMIASVLLLQPISLLPAWSGIAGPGYALTATVLGFAFLLVTLHGVWTLKPIKLAKQIFAGSIVYLTVLLIVLMLRL
jgi:heme o synthase